MTRYVQLNTANELKSGAGRDRLERTADGRVRIIDEWAWESANGAGSCVMESTE